MTYEEILAHIYGLRRFGIRPGLARISALLQQLGNPQESFAVIHVVGTNGKGSTAAFLASLLTAGGYRTGLFTSPHLISFTERFRLDGTEIAEERAGRLAERVLAAAPPGTTFFEVVTALALLWFAEAGVAVAVVEAGMGGGHDATSAANGLMTVITPIALDHCEWLGASLPAIAREKGAIIKPGTPVVLSRQPEAVSAVLAEQCRRGGNSLVRLDNDFSAAWHEDGTLAYHGLARTLSGLRPGIGGRYQADNAATALAAAESLGHCGFPLPETAFGDGLAAARWPGRMELFPGPPRILLDGAHNPAGAAALAASLGGLSRSRLFMVLGVMGDKDLAGILSPLLPLAGEVVAVTPTVERALPSALLAAECASRGCPAVDGGSVAAGLALARQRATDDDLILVCGSLFTVGEARAVLLTKRYEPFRG
ncbi:bifunctional folylpolyglutamate synthase/dihydrofolate synthase [Geotalea uraniireducens]|uniref:Dihydrofolate synthase/folylpolyglutamate synthase n=1 Tax=Geotalea uraniireducens TaxID=351604 RepID=A0ABM8EN13_9BACT|nr:folylpolyglutamate synthase/dihydrofolate synthase family protein [Geotalea uraniireducens]BDV43801.1 bifunctional folylpolyglutamate synthase/dihydrofolate synthase [Geotalea uraniireducens]